MTYIVLHKNVLIFIASPISRHFNKHHEYMKLNNVFQHSITHPLQETINVNAGFFILLYLLHFRK